MNFLRASLLGFSLFFCFPLFATHTSKIYSTNGVVILNNGEKITGELHFFYKSDLIQIVESPKKSKAFSAHQVNRFRFYDEHFKTDRVFVSAELRQRNYDRLGFYEVISWGEIEVLGKLKYEDKSKIEVYRKPNHKAKHKFLPRLITHDYFVYYNQGFMPLKLFYKQVLSELCEKDQNLITYIESEQLNKTDVYTQIKIIAHYNNKVSDENYNMQEFIE